MAWFVFVGDPRAPGTDPQAIEAWGVVFPLGEAAEVSNETVAAKLRRHSHFSEIPSGEPSAPGGSDPVAALLARADSMRFLAFRSAAGKLLGGVAPATKAEIVASLQAKALT